LHYALNYRDIEEMMIERGLSVDHITIFHWIQEYARIVQKLDLGDCQKVKGPARSASNQPSTQSDQKRPSISAN
jgi:transposase-like protein